MELKKIQYILSHSDTFKNSFKVNFVTPAAFTSKL